MKVWCIASSAERARTLCGSTLGHGNPNYFATLDYWWLVQANNTSLKTCVHCLQVLENAAAKG